MIVFMHTFNVILGLENLRIAASIAVLVMWMKLFYWMRLFGPTAFFIRMIEETIYDIRTFAIMFIFCVMSFANGLYVLNYGRSAEGEDDLFVSAFGIGMLDAIIDQYMLGLGEFGTDNFKGKGKFLAWIYFLLATFITQITFLNMLIAIMGDTFDRVSEAREQSALKEKINILSDYIWMMRDVSNENESKYVYVVRPMTLGDNEGNEWEGKIS